MRKTSVYLSDAASERLADLAEREGRPQAAIIRDAIARYEPPVVGDRDFAMFDTGEGDGRSVADIPEEELLEGFGE
ncbi:MAG: CopG family transcriptional regulator [Solirubrobacteraceae bacterium]